ncbi:MAG: hypothetical protein K2M00_09160 [Muribaculaceae bacterium]|nr:hypothetical protein [Muribaculaceae bacterium]
MAQDEIEYRILNLYKDLEVGQIVLDGQILCILDYNSDISAQQLSDALKSLVDRNMISVAPNGFKLETDGYKYLEGTNN